MLGNGLHKGIVASTVSEIRGAIPLVEEGLLDQVSAADHVTSRFIADDKVPLRITRISWSIARAEKAS